jgi:hypothetical protein
VRQESYPRKQSRGIQVQNAKKLKSLTTKSRVYSIKLHCQVRRLFQTKVCHFLLNMTEQDETEICPMCYTAVKPVLINAFCPFCKRKCCIFCFRHSQGTRQCCKCCAAYSVPHDMCETCQSYCAEWLRKGPAKKTSFGKTDKRIIEENITKISSFYKAGRN